MMNRSLAHGMYFGLPQLQGFTSTILDPFMGSGSTGKAAGLENFSFVGIEKEQSYLEIAEKRIKAVYDLESGSESTKDDNVADWTRRWLVSSLE